MEDQHTNGSGAARARTLAGLQLLATAAVLAGTAALLVGATAWGERLYLIRHRADAPWITLPQAPTRASAIRVQRDQPPRFVFERSFRVLAPPERAVVHVRALREIELRVNGTPVELSGRDPRRWKRASSVDVAPLLRPGANQIEAELVHREGPVLLQLWSEDLGRSVATRPGWRIHSPGSEHDWNAVVADDVRHYPPSAELPIPAEVLRARWPVLLAVFLLCAVAGWVRLPWPAAFAGAHWPRTAFAALAIFWLALFATKTRHFPNFLGFDGEGHNAYIDLLANERRLPRADEGWEAFHPPLYHAATAGLRLATGTQKASPLDRGLVRLLPTLAGLLCAWLAGRTALRLRPDAPGLAAGAVLAAGLLPMNLYVSSFASNESVHAAFVAGALWLTCGLLVATRRSTATLWWTSLLLGLALLTKSTTSLPVAGALAGLVAAKALLVERRGPAAAARDAAVIAAGPLVLSGWFYWRNWRLFGDPFVSNLGSYAAWTYWLPPGFHTPAWFAGFGEVLRHPFFASFASYWDGLYGSFWSDGYASGRAGVMFPNPWWDYESMVAVVPLALPATGILLLGLAVCAGRALSGTDLGRRLAWSMLLLVAYGMSLMLVLATLRIPFNAMPKAFYTLPALVPLAVAFAEGVAWLHGRGHGAAGRALRATLSGYLGVLAFSIVVAFLR